MDGVLTPALTFAVMAAAGAILFGALIAAHLGGKWVWRLWLLVMVGIGLGLIWFFAFSRACCPTGMEGLALVIWPLIGLGVGVGLFVGYAAATLLKKLTGPL